MTYNIVTQRLEGSIEVESEPKKGTQFTMRLPIYLEKNTTQDFDHFSL